MTPTTFAIKQYDNGLELRIEPNGKSIYLLARELGFSIGYKLMHTISDLSHLLFIERHRLMLLSLDTQLNDGDGVVPALTVYCDTDRLFKCLRILRMRGVNTSIPISKFKQVIPPDPVPTVIQLANCPLIDPEEKKSSRFGKTLACFRRACSDEQFQQLKRMLFRYAQMAKIYSQGEEFYFDGRGMSFGMNGAFIPRPGTEYGFSVHT